MMPNIRASPTHEDRLRPGRANPNLLAELKTYQHKIVHDQPRRQLRALLSQDGSNPVNLTTNKDSR
jgi:hypothetical protein